MYIKEKNKGITLISLVVTVIVLLILAGVALTMLSGENGILTRAKTAREQHKAGQELEENRIAGMENVMGQYLGNTAPGSTTGGANSGSGTGSGTGEGGSGGTSPNPQTVTYTVIYNSNGGTGTMESQEFTVGTAQNLSTNSFEKNGFEFLGWNTNQNATTATYANGVEINNENNLSTTNGEEVNLYAIWKLAGGGTATGGNITYSDGTSTATIPEGWTVSGFSDEQTIANGLVIYDLGGASVTWTEANRATIQQSYNQFVWVPVSLAEDATSMPRYDGYYNGSKQTYVSNSNVTEPYASGYSTEASEYTAMVNSVKSNGGFYVGRYEASSNGGIAESKKGKTPWVSIAWGSSMKSPGTSGAVAKAKAMYEGSSTTAKSSVTSTLIYGCQWDAILNWIDPNFSTGNCVTTGSNKSVLVDSTGKGYYSQSSKTSTSSSTNYAMKNIYDMAGNVYEWTMEAYSPSNRVYRGGGYSDTGSSSPVSSRNNLTSSFPSADIGFRATLYCNAES